MTNSQRVIRARTFRHLLLAAPILTPLGCGADFDSQEQVKTLRVLAVQKDQPYAAPSKDPPSTPKSVNMTMLWHDGSVPWNKDSRPIQRLWFSGCDDLPADQYFSCLARIYVLWQLYTGSTGRSLADLTDGESWSPVDSFGDAELQLLLPQASSQLAAELAREPDPQAQAEVIRAYFYSYRIGAGDRFTYPIPPRIIENHRGASGSSTSPFGLSFVFFTACAGHIDVAPEWKNLHLSEGATLRDATLGFPFICLDGTGKADSNGNIDTTGKTLGPDDYVAGYTEQFVYADPSVNLNPIIEDNRSTNDDKVPVTDSIAFDGKLVPVDAVCVGDACVPEPSNPGPPPDPAPPHYGCLDDAPLVNACSSNCPKLTVVPKLVADKNNEVDTFASVEGRTLSEQMWIDYYADRGKINHTAKSLRDATLGWFPDHGSTWTPPSDPGPVNIWAVVHDNRGGVAWVRLQVCVE